MSYFIDPGQKPEVHAHISKFLVLFFLWLGICLKGWFLSISLGRTDPLIAPIGGNVN
jgi:hypothetical protein